MTATNAYGALEGQTTVSPIVFQRPDPVSNEVFIEILFCGICHSDVEILANHWGVTKYPCVPGHEAVGVVTRIGPDVTKFKVDQFVGIGCMVDSCGTCNACKEGWENHCEGPRGPTMTYGGYLLPRSEEDRKFNNFGCWADNVVVREEFVIPLPRNVDLARVAPLMCPGTAVFGPLTRFNIASGDKIGIIGLGGPGHLAVQIAKAMGAHVTVFTTHEAKRGPALRIGADEVILSADDTAMNSKARSLQHILSTVPVPFDPTPYLRCLIRRGSLTIMGLLGSYEKIMNNFDLAVVGLSISGSMIGSIKETQQCLQFCIAKKIFADVEIVQRSGINAAIDRLKAADVRFRFVVDMKAA